MFLGKFALLSRIFLVSVFLTSFNVFFAPTSQSPMSKLRFSESLGQSNGKKWSQIWKLLHIKGVKSPRRKSFLRFFYFILFVHIVFKQRGSCGRPPSSRFVWVIMGHHGCGSPLIDSIAPISQPGDALQTTLLLINWLIHWYIESFFS